MKRILLVALFATISIVASAQKKQKLAYYNQDSILSIWPSYHMGLDSMARYEKIMLTTLMSLDSAIVAKKAALHVDSINLSASIYAVRLNEISMMEQNMMAFSEAVKIEADTISSQLTRPLKRKMDAAAQKVAKEKGYKVAYESKTAKEMAAAPGSNYELIDITDLVIIELKIASVPKR